MSSPVRSVRKSSPKRSLELPLYSSLYTAAPYIGAPKASYAEVSYGSYLGELSRGSVQNTHHARTETAIENGVGQLAAYDVIAVASHHVVDRF